LLDTYIEESSNARLARLLMEQKENQGCGENGATLEPRAGVPEVDAHPVSDNVFPGDGLPRGRNRTVS
jgi:hypothetical protein